jgi:hypothetical protein
MLLDPLRGQPFEAATIPFDQVGVRLRAAQPRQVRRPHGASGRAAEDGDQLTSGQPKREVGIDHRVEHEL